MKTGTYLAVSALVTLLFVAPAFAQYAPPPSTPNLPAYSCPQLSYNLYRGLSDYSTQGQVSQLQQFLSASGYYQSVTGYFGPMTYANVARFQQQYAVYPVTGGVGPLTRAAIARVCGGTVYPPPPTTGGLSITNVSGPNSLAVGQQGTWNITTNAPYGSYLSTSVRWGDENIYPYPMSPSAGYVSQNASFTHSYSQAGTYTITFAVTDNTGRSAQATASVVVGGGGCTNQWYGNCQYNVTAYPQTGYAPLTVTFAVSNYSGLYAVSFGDGTSASLQSGSVTHTYYTRGTYAAQFSSDAQCFHSDPACRLLTQNLGSATVTVY